MLNRTVIVALLLTAGSALAADTSRGDKMLAEYFRIETQKLADRTLADVTSLDDWKQKRETLHKQLLEMLGLDPMPEKTDLKPVITGKIEHEEFTVEKLHFQSRPGLYVTGNLYIPKKLDKPAPAILYVCGHSNQKKGNISFGNKAGYQHHGEWFARHGYVCLTIDSLQLGEIEGIHHGTHRFNMWWWLNRGYTPAGVEAWNCIRALDYLETRKEVDKTRFGVTGRSGGGAYSWWIAAIDERIKVAVPVAGITDLQNHVVDGCVEGHCDCMYMHNTYQWDYATVAALVAPRPLLISNSDKDSIFPLDGVVRIHQKVRDIYALYGAKEKLGLHITEGPHKDTQELRIHAFVWFNRFLKNENPDIDVPATKLFEPSDLRVFGEELPKDEKNTKAHEWFVKAAEPAVVPNDLGVFTRETRAAMITLSKQVFRAWPSNYAVMSRKQTHSTVKDGVRFTAHEFEPQAGIKLNLYVACRDDLTDAKPELVVLNVLDEQGWKQWLAWSRSCWGEALKDELVVEQDQTAIAQQLRMLRNTKWAFVYLAPRGVGPTAFDPSAKKQTQNRRRLMLLGQTLDGMQTFDIRRAINEVRRLDQMIRVPLWLQGERIMAGNVLYAALLEKDIVRLDLWHLPTSHRNGPIYMNISRHMDIPQTLLMAATRSQVRVYGKDEGWDYVKAGAKAMGLDEKQIEFRAAPE
ncbi:MAG: alpha/beta hydrolase family protein [Phycisphaeraceae bacterium]